ncbi:CPXV167 protein [Cowpox virus]|uniref:CPXV167 protein n=1 Tax=Cowpox virus TaxID=10243 RepID=U5TEY5_COWPX|nr:CPXV167 protein [Cowpox virus]AGY97451.1 CPXV167 protein [Cowpox virus]AGY98103.1 CPXV167 protein [Cowpox virus]AGY98526.1 CPXV167 protein [Cowpox virus]AGY98741.1 CPXV167 protein [Cowpox virus]
MIINVIYITICLLCSPPY